jgi:hypothetical protein
VFTQNCDTRKLSALIQHCAANRKRRLLALPNVSPYIYTTLKFLALQGAQYMYDISRLRVKSSSARSISIHKPHQFVSRSDCHITQRQTSALCLHVRYCCVKLSHAAHQTPNRKVNVWLNIKRCPYFFYFYILKHKLRFANIQKMLYPAKIMCYYSCYVAGRSLHIFWPKEKHRPHNCVY